MKYCTDKDINEIVVRLVRRGWRARKGRRHLKIRSADGEKLLITSISPSDCRAIHKVRHDLKMMGVKL